MPFNKETASKAGKKSKRGQSKATIAVKNKILDYLNDEGIDDAIKEIKELEGLYKVKAIIEIAQYAIPKQKAVDLSATIEDHKEDMPLKDIEAEIARLKKINDKEFETFDDD